MNNPAIRATKRRWIVSTGDPAGCSPELIVPLLQARQAPEQLIFVGPAELIKQLKLKLPVINKIPTSSGAYWWSVGEISPEQILSGKPNKNSGRVAIKSLKQALNLVDQSKADGLLTLPLNKAAVQAGGEKSFTGHTEFLEAHWNQPAVMSFFGEQFNCALLTRHIPLNEVCQELTLSRVINRTVTINRFFEKYENKSPRLALLGLNPHSGEKGLLGCEEEQLLKPAIQQLTDRGINISGPHPADSFLPIQAATTDCVIACYHDQGLIPFKLSSLLSGIQVSMGLPVLRVSPSHGTAASLAGTGKINPLSTVNCLVKLRQWRTATD